MASIMLRPLLQRDEESIEDKFLRLMKDPFGQELNQDSIVIAVGTSLAITSAIFLAFCILRPFNAIVYAPRVRHTDEKHRPPVMGKSVFAWYRPVFTTREDEYVEKIGLDATIFLRVARMCRNMFAVLAIVGCAIIIPVNVTQSKKQQNAAKAKSPNNFDAKSAILLMTPIDLSGGVFWWFIGVAYLFDIIICVFLWWTYRAVHKLRRKYMDSPDYQNSLHSRTLMITDVNRNLRSDQGLLDIVDNLRTTPEVPRASIGRNVKDIPDLIEQHEKAVVALEKVLAKYLKNPNKLPATRPLCKPSRDDLDYTDKNEKVDAITYLTSRIERLEAQIKEVRETVDRRDAMPYGFVSYETLESAHTVAFTARNKHPLGTTVNLAPRPKDVIWKNLPLDAKTRRWKRFINNSWITLLTVLYFIPNALIAVFLANLSNLAQLWEEFGVIMARNQKFWAIVQGLAAPALTSLFYYFLPIIFRRLSVQAGDLTKTSRERHVIHQLYAFFVFNNLFIFSLFAAAFTLVTTGIAASRKETNGRKPSFTQVIEEIHPFQTVMAALCNISSFWVTWLVQRNLGAAIDLGQFVNLAWGSFSRKFLNPTPRELIKRTAPPPFDYASYYNYFLFYSTVALCFAPLQPITLAVTAFYFTIDASMKKYLLMYVFCTKHESGGLYWRVIYNRFLVGTFLSNCIIALMVGAKGGEDKRNMMLAAMLPLPLLLAAFKFYCRYAFDSSIKYYTKGDAGKGAEASAPIDGETRRRDRVAVRYGHPALFQKLTVPMVHEKSKHLLGELYRGRLDGDVGNAGYSDVYMKRMSMETPGKAVEMTGPFEFVSEGNMDFENFKNRPEFSDDHGGEGSIYGLSLFSRPDTPNGFDSRPGTPSGSVRGRSISRDSERTFADHDAPGVTYPAGYHSTPSNLREFSPSPDGNGFGRLESKQSSQYTVPLTPLRDESTLLSGAAPMGQQTGYTPYSPDQDGGQDYFRK